MSSTAVYDYTSSGLENVLAYLLITSLLLQIVRLTSAGARNPAAGTGSASRIALIGLLSGLILVTRHDLFLLVLPPVAYVVWRHRHAVQSWWPLIVLALLPLAVWTVFSLVYYGFPFPNTAHAKLNTGVDRADLVIQGGKYLMSALLHDAITPLIIISALIVTHGATRQWALRFVGYGIALNVFYITWVGGDFMQGRFLSYSCLSAVVVLTLAIHGEPRSRRTTRVTAATAAVVAVYAVLYPHTPLNCWRPDISHQARTFDVRYERDVYAELALREYLASLADGGPFPDHRWIRDGLWIRYSEDPIAVVDNIGMVGYSAGTEKIIVDPLALADPFLARLPARTWRAGHFIRDIPAGYLRRIRDGTPMEPTRLDTFYTALAVLTQADEFLAMERLREILAFNLGRYDERTHLLLYGDGWHPVEHIEHESCWTASDPACTRWRWTYPTATLSIVNPSSDATFFLDYAARPDLFESPQLVTVSIGDRAVGSFFADEGGRRSLRFPIPAWMLGASEVIDIRITVDRTFVPADVIAGATDKRRLGIVVYDTTYLDY